VRLIPCHHLLETIPRANRRDGGGAGGKKRGLKNKSKVRFTIMTDAALLALARAAVHQMKGMTLASLIAMGLRLAIRHLEQQRGKRFRPTPDGSSTASGTTTQERSAAKDEGHDQGGPHMSNGSEHSKPNE
jgi:hypothetical protein